MSGACDQCAHKGTSLQREATAEIEFSGAPFIGSELLRSPGQALDAPTRALVNSHVGHDFSRIRPRSQETLQHRDAAADEEVPSASSKKSQPPLSETPAARTETGPPAGAIPAHTEGSGTATCPSKSVVDTTTNATADGVKYRTGMGAVTTIKVEPDNQTWDGKEIVESFPKPLTSDCPKEFGISPCAGNSHFIVGASRNSPVFGALPATKNRFYDFHETRWKGGSLLHDRNPGGIASCKISCEQNYACGGVVIGKHTITRTFTRNKVGSVDVTFVKVSKT